MGFCKEGNKMSGAGCMSSTRCRMDSEEDVCVFLLCFLCVSAENGGGIRGCFCDTAKLLYY